MAYDDVKQLHDGLEGLELAEAQPANRAAAAVPGVLHHGLFGLGLAGSEWDLLSEGGSLPQLDFRDMLSQRSGGESEFATTALPGNDHMPSRGWGTTASRGDPMAGPRPGHTHPGNGQTLPSSATLGDWRIPGSSRRLGQDLHYPPQNGHLTGQYEQAAAGSNGNSSTPARVPPVSGCQTLRQPPPGRPADQLSSAHGIGLHLHALFQEAGYRGRGDSCQPGSERDIWKISNGNGLSSLSTVKPIKLPLQLSNLDVNVANESTGDLMEEVDAAIHALTGANPAGALIAATPLLRLRDLQAGQTLIGIP
eukprot:jgi/Tetstr1/458553/TSEL_044956.t1